MEKIVYFTFLFLILSSPQSVFAVNCVTLDNNLYLGARDNSVVLLQSFLESTGDYTETPIHGYFGLATQRAVEHFQKRNGIVSGGNPITTGYGAVGPVTRKAINEYCLNTTSSVDVSSTPDITVSTSSVTPAQSLSPSTSELPITRTLTMRSRGVDVQALQEFLKKEGDYTYPEVTGYFGPVTQEAVQKFQARTGIVSSGSPQTTGYGLVGPSTRRALAQAMSESTSTGPSSVSVADSTPQPINITPTTPPIDPILPPELDVQVQLTTSSSIAAAGESIKFTWISDSALVCSQPIRANEKGNIDWHKHLKYSKGQTQGSAMVVPYPLPEWQDFNGAARYEWMIGCRGFLNPDQVVTSAVPIEFKKEEPKAGLDAHLTSGEAPLTVNFSANLEEILGTQRGGAIELDFGDGQIGTLCKTYSSGVAACTPSWIGSHVYKDAGTYVAKLIWQYESGGSFILDTVKIVVNSQKTPQQNLIINGFNVYSPDMVLREKESLKMYFGGWMSQGQRHDDIYLADCVWDGSSCSNIRTVISATTQGFNHLNNPSIVRLVDSANTGRAYYIMYLTGVEQGENGFVPGNNHLYYSTSWADNGVNWSKPQLLLKSHWLPSAIVKENGEVELYANDNTIHGGVVKINLGTSGVNVGTIERVSYGTEGHFANVDVEYDFNDKQYHIVAERMDAKSSIDRFTSRDGVNWNLTHKKIISADTDQYRVGTPTFHPSKREILFFGSTAKENSTGFKIRSMDTTGLNTSLTSFIKDINELFVNAFQRGVSSLANSFSAILLMGC
ncbi:MAG: peptidoglycan-binding protein [Patescibacteria group bacterium UBA2163]